MSTLEEWAAIWSLADRDALLVQVLRQMVEIDALHAQLADAKYGPDEEDEG